MPTVKNPSLPQIPTETGFGLGFFCGVLLGAVGVYLVVTPEGRNLKKTLVEDFKKHQQTFILESVVPHDNKDAHKESSVAKTIHALIAKTRKYINPSPNIPISKEPVKITTTKKKHIFKKK